MAFQKQGHRLGRVWEYVCECMNESMFFQDTLVQQISRLNPRSKRFFLCFFCLVEYNFSMAMEWNPTLDIL